MRKKFAGEPALDAKRPKYQTISELVKAGISINPKVPSARQVAREHGVSLVTASRALQVLKDEGLIRIVERSGSFLASENKAPRLESKRWGLLLRSTPGAWRYASIAVLVEGFQAVTECDGSVLDNQTMDSDRWDAMEPEAIRVQVRRWLEAGMSGLFFMPSRYRAASATWDELFLERCRVEGLPVVLVERNLRGINRPLTHDLLASDDFDGGYQSASHLVEQGCRRLVFVTGSPTSSHETRLAGVLTAVRDPFQSRPRVDEPRILVQNEGLPTREAFEELADKVLEIGADGVICYQDYTAVGLIIELLQRRARVPDDIAITGFDNLPIGNSFALGVTSYASPGIEMASAALRLMRSRIENPGRSPMKAFVPGTLILRESSLRT